MTAKPLHKKAVCSKAMITSGGLIAAGGIVVLAAGIEQSPPLSPRTDIPSSGPACESSSLEIYETEHFAVAHDSEEPVVAQLAQRLEDTFSAVSAFCKGLGLPINAPRRRLQVRFYGRGEGLQQCRASLNLPADREVSGFYSPEADLLVVANTLRHPQVMRLTEQIERIKAEADSLPGKAARGSRRSHRRKLIRSMAKLKEERDALVERSNRLVVRHEAAHQVLYNLGVHVRGARNPLWLVEGLACLFEVLPDDHANGPHRVNRLRLADFRQGFGLRAGDRFCPPGHYRWAIESRRMVTLVELIRDEKAITEPEALQVLRYSQSWALVYYLYSTRPADFSRYLLALSRRTDGAHLTPEDDVALFTGIFGPFGDDFERQWISSILALPEAP